MMGGSPRPTKMYLGRGDFFWGNIEFAGDAPVFYYDFLFPPGVI
jgi:hypothetical protein